MQEEQIIECVPNFSEGRNQFVIKQIAEEITAVNGVKLLHTDPGKSTNRTVMTFIGSPKAVTEAAFQAIKKASELIDMSTHTGEHPRIGATDVCPLVPINGITMEETVLYARQLAKRVGEELGIPVYLYEYAAVKPGRNNLADIRSGEYEALSAKLQNEEWQPDFGPSVFNAKAGATVIGARNFLVAYNINLKTTSVNMAAAIASDIRESGRIKKENGRNVVDKMGVPVRSPGMLKNVKAIGWYIKEYGIAQVSVNITNIDETPLHVVFETVVTKAKERGISATGSELIGLIPLRCLLTAGKYFLEKKQKESEVGETELIEEAVKSLGLDELCLFDPRKKIIEYLIHDEQSLFADKNLTHEKRN
jgi:glutamate formiminotransferase